MALEPGDEAGASAAALRLGAALERSFQVGDVSVHVDASVGIALFPDHATDGVGLLQGADVAMYEAKRMRTGLPGVRVGSRSPTAASCCR